jgi:hypothetical protein
MTLPCDRRTDEDLVADLNAELRSSDHLDGDVGAFFIGMANALLVSLCFWAAVLLVVFG